MRELAGVVIRLSMWRRDEFSQRHQRLELSDVGIGQEYLVSERLVLSHITQVEQQDEIDVAGDVPDTGHLGSFPQTIPERLDLSTTLAHHADQHEHRKRPAEAGRFHNGDVCDDNARGTQAPQPAMHGAFGQSHLFRQRARGREIVLLYELKQRPVESVNGGIRQDEARNQREVGNKVRRTPLGVKLNR